MRCLWLVIAAVVLRSPPLLQLKSKASAAWRVENLTRIFVWGCMSTCGRTPASQLKLLVYLADSRGTDGCTYSIGLAAEPRLTPSRANERTSSPLLPQSTLPIEAPDASREHPPRILHAGMSFQLLPWPLPGL